MSLAHKELFIRGNSHLVCLFTKHNCSFQTQSKSKLTPPETPLVSMHEQTRYFSTWHVSFCLFFLLCVLKVTHCRGIFAWEFYPFVNFRIKKNNAKLKAVTYLKRREDTTLRVTFQSTLGQSKVLGCNEWFVRFDDEDCEDPAPIISLIYSNRSMNMCKKSDEWNIAPAVVGGFCNATESMRPITAGYVHISVHVKQCVAGRNLKANITGKDLGDAHTGTPRRGKSTSSLLVEEYCRNWNTDKVCNRAWHTFKQTSVTSTLICW